MAKTVTLPKSRNLGFCAIAAILLLTSASPLSASYTPSTLDRIPALIGQEEVWEITKLEAVNWAEYSLMKYPSGIDVKNLINAGEEDITLAVISDCGWSRLIFIKTSWGNEIALDEFGAYGRLGRGSGEVRFPVGVAIGNYNNDFDPTLDFIYVVDAINHRIVMLRYDHSSNELSWFYSFGDGNLINPRGILYYDNGTASRVDDEIFVTDSRLSQVLRFNSEGTFLGAYGTPGRNTGQIFTPYGICAGPSNSEWERFIYITDIYNYKICQFELDIQNNLEFRKEIVLSLSPSRSKLMGITSDAFGTIYVADRQKNCLLKLSPDLELIAVINEETAGSDFRFFKPQVVRYHDNGLIVIDKFSETSGFKFFEVLSLGALKWSENWYGDIELKSDILVPCGTTLDLKPGAQIQVTPYYDEYNLGIDPKRVEIIVEGTLNSNGTISDSVLIYSAGSPPNRGDWYGIRVQEPCGMAILSHTSVRDAEYGIEFYDGTTDDNHVYGFIKDSQLEKNATAGIYSNKGILYIAGSMISDNSIYGFYGSKVDADIRNNEFLRNGRYGIWINLLSKPADSVRILNNVIDGENAATTIDGLYLAHSQARVEGCNIKGYSSTAAKVSSNTSPLFMLDTLECRVGMDCQLGASPTIRYCRIFHGMSSINCRR